MQGPYLRKYATQTTIDFTLYKIDGTALQPTATFAAGDVKVMLDEAAEANATNLPTDEGQTYSIVITAAQMTAARVVVILVDQTSPQLWLDTTLVIDTYGHASAQHALDLGTASTAQTGDSYARLGAPAGASVSADILQVKGYVDDIGAAGAGLSAIPWNAAWDAEVQSEAQDAITASALATAANLATVDTVVDGIETHVHATDGHVQADYGATEKAAIDLLDDANGLVNIHDTVDLVHTDVDAILLDTGTTLDGRIPAALVGGRMDASVGAVAANAIDAAAIKDGAIDAATFAAGAVDAAALAADAANEIADALLDRANAVETSITTRQAMRLILAALSGKLSGAGTTTVTIRNVGDTKSRIIATVDVDGNRSAVTTDVS